MSRPPLPPGREGRPPEDTGVTHPTLLTWLGSPGGTDRRVLLSTSPMRNSDTLQGRAGQGRVSAETHAAPGPPASPQQPHGTHVLLKATAMVSRAFSNSRLSDSLLHS